MRRYGWISLFVLLILAACGPPEVHDINGGGTGVSDDDDSGDDDDDAATTFPTATTPPGSAPTLTNVPSFATWNSSIRPIGGTTCKNCHGGSGGAYFDPNPVDASAAKYLWFQAICDRGPGSLSDPGNGSPGGTQAFSPPTGRFPRYMSGDTTGSNVSQHGGIGNNTTVITNWMAQGAGTTPPDCLTYYDLANSN